MKRCSSLSRHHGGNAEGKVFIWQESNYAHMHPAICRLLRWFFFPKRTKTYICIAVNDAHGWQYSISLFFRVSYRVSNMIAWLLLKHRTVGRKRAGAGKMWAVRKPYQIGAVREAPSLTHVRAQIFCLRWHSLPAGGGVGRRATTRRTT